MKKFENQLIFGEVMGNSLVSCFFDSLCNYWIQYSVIYEPTEFHRSVSLLLF